MASVITAHKPAGNHAIAGRFTTFATSQNGNAARMASRAKRGRNTSTTSGATITMGRFTNATVQSSAYAFAGIYM